MENKYPTIKDLEYKKKLKEQDKLTLQTHEMNQADSLAQNQTFSYQSPHRKALWLVWSCVSL